ncbi:hypothetical protein D9757_014387 [Collybiopsis confluens]|uniref:Ubiquitin-like protease family profile domain-containing protein n=1 Tax=Collybiopsis confluens TaxID=2823264 RepID=A0A8H5FW39_9AGAR|nr:hypothetical protein D9757_014387 [Collybiopsis confluens]
MIIIDSDSEQVPLATKRKKTDEDSTSHTTGEDRLPQRLRGLNYPSPSDTIHYSNRTPRSRATPTPVELSDSSASQGLISAENEWWGGENRRTRVKSGRWMRVKTSVDTACLLDLQGHDEVDFVLFLVVSRRLLWILCVFFGNNRPKVSFPSNFGVIPPKDQPSLAVSILQLQHLVNDCQLLLPALNLSSLLAATKVEDTKEFIEQRFLASASAPEEVFYVHSEAHLKALRELSTKLSSASSIFTEFTVSLRRHEYLPSDGLVLKVFGNLQLLLEFANTKRTSLEQTVLKALDDYPEATEARLRKMMSEVSVCSIEDMDILALTVFGVDSPSSRSVQGEGSSCHIANFSTLGVGRWVDDEIVNYFVTKWCHRSTVLGLSTFFASKNLFQGDSCSFAKSGTLTAEAERQALRWCINTMKNLDSDNWDSVFIPINENQLHWYSAYIDFRLKRIEIFDSLETTCITNRDKPLSLQKNMKLMLVLMWLAEVLGRLRGERVILKNNPETDWVPFQPNSYDCGIHCLWHLQHLLQFRQIKRGSTAELVGLAFTDNMRLDNGRHLAPRGLSKTSAYLVYCIRDRDLHLDLKEDGPHRKYTSLQARRISRQFNNTADAALVAATTSHNYATTSPQLTTIPNHSVNRLAVEPREDGNMDVDMDVDHGVDGNETDDSEGSIEVEVPDTGVDEESRKDAVFSEVLEIAAEIMLEHSDAFNFLPESAGLEATSVEMQEEDNNDATTGQTYRRMDRTLLEEDVESRTYKWHPTAGKTYGYKPDVHMRWKRLFSSSKMESRHDSYRPFSSRLDWELAQWVIQEKITHSSFDRFLQIPEVKEKLGLGYTNTRGMLDKVDQIPDRCGVWYTKELAFKDRPDEKFTVRHRNPVNAIKALWGDLSLSKHLVYKPTKLFRGSIQSDEERIFSEMWTAATNTRGGTIAPVIIASDKTQLTQFSGNKSAYPVYLTIGNIPKSLRRKPGTRACVLIAYLSIDKPTKSGLSKTALKLRNYELFHCSMATVLEPLKMAGNPEGGGVEMVGGDGAVRKVYPLLATYVADYPEQCLITCTKYGTCPKCRCKASELELSTPGEPRTQKWTTATIRSARKSLSGMGDRKIHTLTMADDVAGGKFDPFWVGFPLTDIHRCISPDVLHQLYLGVLKHLLSWVQEVVGVEELDKRVRILPMSFGVRHFGKGISALSQASGTEYKHIARILLACLVGKVNSKGLVAIRSLLSFIQLAQYPSHDQETIGYMKADFDIWHKNRSYFIQEGLREDFNIPKFHSLLHYIDSIRWLGTTDNYNTESFERLHIDFAKEGWRASNKRDHFPQMVQWLSRQEKVASFDFYQSWVDAESGKSQESNHGNENDGDGPDEHSTEADESSTFSKISALTACSHWASFQLTKSPNEPRKKLTHIVASHAAPTLISELKLFLNSLLPVDQQVDKASAIQSILPFTAMDVWHQCKFTPVKLLEDAERETLKAIPITRRNLMSRFDTVIILDGDEAESTAVEGCRAGRLRVIFRLPSVVYRHGFPIPAPDIWPKVPLAYVSWYSRFKRAPDTATGMYRIEPALNSQHQPQVDATFSSLPPTDLRLERPIPGKRSQNRPFLFLLELSPRNALSERQHTKNDIASQASAIIEARSKREEDVNQEEVNALHIKQSRSNHRQSDSNEFFFSVLNFLFVFLCGDRIDILISLNITEIVESMSAPSSPTGSLKILATGNGYGIFPPRQRSMLNCPVVDMLW